MNKQLPISLDLAGASWAQYMAKGLVRFKAGRQGEGPSWEGRGEAISAGNGGVPLTDRGWWEGRWVLCPLTLCGSDGSRLELADAVASVSRERIVVSTALTGMDGTVKEYINEGDWSVKLVVGLQPVRGGEVVDEWPETELRELRRLLELKEALEVRSAFLDVFKITRLVVKSWSVVQSTESNYQSVSISAVSDEPYEIFSKEY